MDGQNDRRAIRVAEMMNDYRTLQHFITQFRATPSAAEYNEEGFALLRQCFAEAQTLLSANFDTAQTGSGPEAEKGQLQRIMLDASVRRFRAQRIYLRASAASRWASARAAILQGQKPHAGHALALAQLNLQLQNELSVLTDDRILNDLRNGDYQAGRWIAEDPSPNTIQTWARAGR